jgi:hypothetical protein
MNGTRDQQNTVCEARSRGIMLKGADFADLQADVAAMAAFALVAMGVAVA